MKHRISWVYLTFDLYVIATNISYFSLNGILSDLAEIIPATNCTYVVK